MSVSGTRKVATSTQRQKFIAEGKGTEVDKVDTSNSVLVKDDGSFSSNDDQNDAQQEKKKKEGFFSSRPYVPNVIDVQNVDEEVNAMDNKNNLDIYNKNSNNDFNKKDDVDEFV